MFFEGQKAFEVGLGEVRGVFEVGHLWMDVLRVVCEEIGLGVVVEAF